MQPSTLSPEADWKLVRAFLAVMQAGTLTRAAELLGTTQPTVGRQIRELERLSGEVYFLRKGNRLQPTERAEAMFARARDVEASVTGLARELASPPESESATVRITASSIFGVELLPGLLRDLMARTPGVAYEIHATEEIHDLQRRDADIAIRHVDPRQGDLIARKVGNISLGLYATSDYLNRRGRPRTPMDLAGHLFLSNRSGADIQVPARTHGLEISSDQLVMRSDSLLVRLAALRAGVAIGPCHTWLAEERDDLERVIPDFQAGQFPIWLVAHEDLRRSRSLRVAFDALFDLLTAKFLTGPVTVRR